MTKIIEVIISPSGESKIETRGFTGGECRQASEFIERALGQRTKERLTAEFHQTQTTPQHQQERS